MCERGTATFAIFNILSEVFLRTVRYICNVIITHYALMER